MLNVCADCVYLDRNVLNGAINSNMEYCYLLIETVTFYDQVDIKLYFYNLYKFLLVAMAVLVSEGSVTSRK